MITPNFELTRQIVQDQHQGLIEQARCYQQLAALHVDRPSQGNKLLGDGTCLQPFLTLFWPDMLRHDLRHDVVQKH